MAATNHFFWGGMRGESLVAVMSSLSSLLQSIFHNTETLARQLYSGRCCQNLHHVGTFWFHWEVIFYDRKLQRFLDSNSSVLSNLTRQLKMLCRSLRYCTADEMTL
ncbi:hypothetical protein IQ06DRAFT_53007 [Phaeosphaeriaceae sp. SRC1lsM3a]|nr:hypothetical protein IQ06DRAFT_53007 [Stagonospora sp. SRC1lsM3a]